MVWLEQTKVLPLVNFKNKNGNKKRQQIVNKCLGLKRQFLLQLAAIKLNSVARADGVGKNAC